MSEEYLWDGSGPPDPEIERLESALENLRYKPGALYPELPARMIRPPVRRQWLWAAVGLAASALIATGWLWYRRTPHLAQPTAWQISWNGSTPRTLLSGDVVATGKDSSASLDSDFIGQVQVEPDSRLRVLRSTRQEQRLALEHGTIHALIWAPPAQFVVDTPAAKTIDLGCKYNLHVAPDGTGLLTVDMGWVAFQWRNLESFIPAGAACRTWPERGPGIPYFTDSSNTFRQAVETFDQRVDGRNLQVLLGEARPRDALTLWHLLARTQGAQREAVFARFSKLVSLPASVTRDRIMHGDAVAMDAAWDALDLGDTSWWREWKRRW